MANKRQKSPDTLQGHRARPQLVRLDAAPAKPSIPTAPKNLHPVARRAWRQFWSSSLPQVLDIQADDEALRRWAYCLSEREKLEDELRERPFVLGSQGQSVRNPLWGVLKERTREVERFREQFGMSPLHRLRLGVALGEADDARDRMERRRRTVEPAIVEIGGAGRDGDAIEVGT